MELQLILFISLSALIGFFFGFIISRIFSASSLGKLEAQNEQQKVKINELAESQSTLESKLLNTQSELQNQNTELAVLLEKNQRLSHESHQFQYERKTEQERQQQLQTDFQQCNEELVKTIEQRNAALAKTDELKQTIQKLDNHLTLEQEKSDEIEQKYVQTGNELGKLKTSLYEKEQNFKQQISQLDEQKSMLKKEFQNLANEILESKGKAFSQQNQDSLNALLNPFKEQLEGFRKRIDEVHTHQTEGNASLKAELSRLHELNCKITDEASNLTKALKGDKKKQGNWGELQVEMILEQSGLRKGYEYEREANRKDQENKNWRPDFIVNLPENKHVIIDSKVSLIDYNDSVAAENDEQRNQCLERHAQAIRKHINDLYQKDYSQLQGLNSPDFVFMFMPIEPAFIAAFEKDQSLFNTAFEKHIVVVTPTTLLATLRTISNIWSIERQNQNARILADQGSKVYDKLRIFLEKMDKLGHQITTANKTFDEAYNTLTGSRSLTSSVQKFTELGVRVKKELPANVIEPIENKNKV